MRLINTATYELEEFFGDQVPAYAILSHTWEQGQEVTLQEWNLHFQNFSAAPYKRGFSKIKAACALARQDRYRYVWVDTNCIDKTSSAELSEAINSMFSWYAQSEVCYAYVVDADDLASFKSSRWFTRGWTLQELLAPRDLEFFSKDWKHLGSRHHLSEVIAEITSIDRKHLTNLDLEGTCVAEKMNWLADRSTTRAEDLAYCMLGIFDIHMPLLYGEGHSAFRRLQEEIIRVSNDHTIFCWATSSNPNLAFCDIIADSPKAFQLRRQLLPAQKADWKTSSFAMTNAGLHIQIPIIRSFGNVIYAVLGAHWANEVGLGYFLCLPMVQLNNGSLARLRQPAIPLSLPRSWAEVKYEDVWIPLPHQMTQQRIDKTLLGEFGTLELLICQRDLNPDNLLLDIINLRSPLHAAYGYKHENQDVQSTLRLHQLTSVNIWGALICYSSFKEKLDILVHIACYPVHRGQSINQSDSLHWVYEILPPCPRVSGKRNVISQVPPDFWADLKHRLEKGGPFNHHLSESRLHVELGMEKSFYTVTHSDSEARKTTLLPILLTLNDPMEHLRLFKGSRNQLSSGADSDQGRQIISITPPLNPNTSSKKGRRKRQTRKIPVLDSESDQ